MDPGQLPYNEGLMSEIMAYEVIPAKYVPDFDGILDKRKTFIGYPANNFSFSVIAYSPNLIILLSSSCFF